MHHNEWNSNDDRAVEALHEYENVYRRHESTLESQSPLGIGINLEKEWTPEAEGAASSKASSEHLPAPEKVRTTIDSDPEASNEDIRPNTAHRVITAQDWSGPDDPENPQNWPTWKKVYHAIPCALFGFVV